MLKQIIFGLAISIVSTSVYYGNGQFYFSHMNQDAKRGTRMVYRPERYQRYSPLGIAWKCYFTARVYDLSRNGKFYNDLINQPDGWGVIEWDYEGNYYYYENFDNDLRKGNIISFGFAIYNDDQELIYNETSRYRLVPSNITYCELDEKADYNDKKCSAIFGWSEYPEYSSDGNSSTNSKGKVVAAVIIPVLLIALVVGVVIYMKKRRTGSRRENSRRVQNITPANTGIPLNQLQPANTTTQPGKVNRAYQPATQPPTIYQPPLPAASRPPPARPPPYQPQVIQPTTGKPAVVQ